MSSRAVALALALACAGASAAHAAPRGDVEMKTGKVWEDVEYEIRDNRITIQTPYGPAHFEMTQVRRVTESTGRPKPADEAAEEEQATRALDWDGRFELLAPEGWASAPPSSPLVRAELRHGALDATLAVRLRLSPLPWTVEARVPREVSEDFGRDLAARYAKAAAPKVTASTLHGAPVYRLTDVKVTEHGETGLRTVQEVRFRRFGLEYVLTLTTGDGAGALAAEADRLFEVFTFLPAVEETPTGYTDYELGFAISRPEGGWELVTQPFDLEAPVRMATDGGRAEVTVEVQPGSDAAAVLAQVLGARKRASRSYGAERVEEATHAGSKVRRFQFEDYRAQTGSRRLLYKGLAARVGGRVVIVTTNAPLSDDDYRKLDREIEATLEGLKLWDPERIRAEVEGAQEVVALVAQGGAALLAKRWQDALAPLDQAISRSPGFSRAYYLRAQARKGLLDFKGFREDIEKASELEPGAGYDAELAASYEAEAKAAEARKEWVEALRLWIRLYRARRPDLNKKVVNAATQLWNDYKKSKAFHDGMTAVERELRPVSGDEEVTDFLAKTYRDCATSLLREKDYSKAKRWQARMRRLGAKYRADADRLAQEIERAEQAKR